MQVACPLTTTKRAIMIIFRRPHLLRSGRGIAQVYARTSAVSRRWLLSLGIICFSCPSSSLARGGSFPSAAEAQVQVRCECMCGPTNGRASGEAQVLAAATCWSLFASVLATRIIDEFKAWALRANKICGLLVPTRDHLARRRVFSARQRREKASSG